jgi:hypothetical protein
MKTLSANRAQSSVCRASRRIQAPLPATFFSSSWCRRRSAISGSTEHRSGGDDWTHRIKLRPHLASHQQECSELRSSAALGLPCVRAVRPNHLAQGERQRRATRPWSAVPCTFSPTRAWRHTVGTSLSSNVRRHENRTSGLRPTRWGCVSATRFDRTGSDQCHHTWSLARQEQLGLLPSCHHSRWLGTCVVTDLCRVAEGSIRTRGFNSSTSECSRTGSTRHCPRNRGS